MRCYSGPIPENANRRATISASVAKGEDRIREEMAAARVQAEERKKIAECEEFKASLVGRTIKEVGLRAPASGCRFQQTVAQLTLDNDDAVLLECRGLLSGVLEGGVLMTILKNEVPPDLKREPEEELPSLR